MSGLSGWDSSAEDFGQKVDLSVRIREILRNYPEGLSILKELLQNADDAGAHTVRFCSAEARPCDGVEAKDDLSKLLSGPSLLAYNSGEFTSTDFASIQRIGDSLKRSAKNKTGRFGVGVNSSYHLTDVPLFTSSNKVVLFDPQAKFVPGINPLNPGKMIDISKPSGRSLVQSHPHVFEPLLVWGCTLQQPFRGTLFRFGLRNEDVAQSSNLSKQSHSYDKTKDLLQQMADAAPTMLLFLKHVETIEIYDWKSNQDEPVLVSKTNIANLSSGLRQKRSFMMTADLKELLRTNKPCAVDYILHIQTTSESTEESIQDTENSTQLQKWVVCNQMGGARATELAQSNTHDLKLFPWAGVAALLSSTASSSHPSLNGQAYCFLPLPVQTNLPIHINGYFELSSNRRDVWWGDDMAGDGRIRALWNEYLMADVAAPSYLRLLMATKKLGISGSDLQHYFPSSDHCVGPWKTIEQVFYRGIINLPVLHSTSYQPNVSSKQAEPQQGMWVTPKQAVLLHSPDTKLSEILSHEPSLPLVLPKETLRLKLLQEQSCTNTTTPSFLRNYFRNIANDGKIPLSLTLHENKKEEKDYERVVDFALYLLSHCLSDLLPYQYDELDGCPFLPLGSFSNFAKQQQQEEQQYGSSILGIIRTLPPVDGQKVEELLSMGYPKLSCAKALRVCHGDVTRSFEYLYELRATTVNHHHKLDPYLVCRTDEETTLFSTSSSSSSSNYSYIDLNIISKEKYPSVIKFLTSKEASNSLNILTLQSDMMADVLERVLPSNWKSNDSVGDSVQWNVEEDDPATPSKAWFVSFWKYISNSPHPKSILQSIAGRYCVIPTKQGVVCTLSPLASVFDSTYSSHKDNEEEAKISSVLISLGARELFPGVLSTDASPSLFAIPEEIWSYIHKPTKEGVVHTIESSLRRHRSSSCASSSLFDSLNNSQKMTLYNYLLRMDGEEIVRESTKAILKTFPIFRAYTNDISYNTATTHNFVTGLTQTSYFVVKDATAHDKIYMNDEFLCYDTYQERERLISCLGCVPLTRCQFWKRFVLPQLEEVKEYETEEEEKMRVEIIKNMLLVDLPTFCSEDEGFRQIVSGIKFIPTAGSDIEHSNKDLSTVTTATADAANTERARKILKSPKELYDPDVTQLCALMDINDFPNEVYSGPEILMSLRSLGLKTILTWDIILECAKSIEAQCFDNKKEHVLAKKRGKELLSFLDIHCERFFPDLFPKEQSAGISSSFFRRVNAALFDDPEKKKLEAEMQLHRVQMLLSIRWMPVYTDPPHPLLPWNEKSFRDVSVASPMEIIVKEKMWLGSYSRRLMDGDVSSKELKKLFGLLEPVAVVDVAMQLKMLAKTFEKLRQRVHLQQFDTSDGTGNNESNEDEPAVPMTVNALCQTVTSEVPRLYQILNEGVENDIESVRLLLHESSWLWIGNRFIPSDYAAFSSSVNATPYLYTVPPDLACFRTLLKTFGVRDIFQSSDYCEVLRRMADKDKIEEAKKAGTTSSGSKWDAKKVDLAVNLVQALSDDVMKLGSMEIFAPSESGLVLPSSSMVFDDATWLSKDIPAKKGLVFVHPKISSAVAQKIGVQSVRRILLESSTDMISFGDGVVHEAFGQSESLTRRLKNIIDMYPQGSQQISELLQNADDAHATVVKFIVSHKTHGKSSLLGQKMSAWQGPALYCYNDATFTSRDFENLSKIGQASKLEKLETTGRFGLGFNNVYHWTDVPSIVSGDYLIFFDPHAKSVPGATPASPGIKIRFSNTSLVDQFPDQMKPYCHFGNDMQKRFKGTLFRFPFRTEATAADSEISKTQCGKDGAMDELFDTFKKSIVKFLLFLRYVKKVEVYSEGSGNDDSPKLLYCAEVTNRKKVDSSSPGQQRITMDTIQGMAGLASHKLLNPSSVFDASSISKVGNATHSVPGDNWNAVSQFFVGTSSRPLGKQALYSKLQQTSESMLPKTKHVVSITFSSYDDDVKFENNHAEKSGSSNEESKKPFVSNQKPNSDSQVSDEFLVCIALGGGACRDMACDPKHHEMKFLPWGGIAAHLTRNGSEAPPLKGNAFCFLPLPAETGLPVHINGQFELSANRREIWQGEDMTGDGHVRSLWNRLLLADVVAPLYAEMLLSAGRILGPGESFNRLWPVSVNSDVWRIVLSSFYTVIRNSPVLYSSLTSTWVSPTSAVSLELDDNEPDDNKRTTAERLLSILLKENMNIAVLPSSIIGALRTFNCKMTEVSRPMCRAWFKKPVRHPSLLQQDNALFLLGYCVDDLNRDKTFEELVGLPLLPLCSGTLGRFNAPTGSSTNFFVPNETERKLLQNAATYLVDVNTGQCDVNNLLKSNALQEKTNIQPLDRTHFASLLRHSFPNEWGELMEVRWDPSDYASGSGPESVDWISILWGYISAGCNESSKQGGIDMFVDSWQIVPAFVGDQQRILLRLSKDMAVLCLIDPKTGMEIINQKVANVLRSIGIRTLDASIFKGNSQQAVIQTLTDGFVQPPTIQGVLKALSNSFAPDVQDEDLIRRIKLRFKYDVSDSDREKLLGFFRNAAQDIDEKSIQILRTLPLFKIFNQGKEEFSDLIGKWLPPKTIDEEDNTSILDATFVKAANQKDRAFLNRLGVMEMDLASFYESHVCPKIIEGSIIDKERESAIFKLMAQDLPAIIEGENGQAWVDRISQLRFIPNRNGLAVRAKDLYDPNESALVELLDETMLPAKKFCQGNVLLSLRTLGMRTKLSSDGVIDIARSIESMARTTDEYSDTQHIIRGRAKSLLHFIDKEETMRSLLLEAKLSFEASNDGVDTISEMQTEELIDQSNPFLTELNEISWLPVECHGDQADNHLEPPRKKRELSHIGIAAPRATRPKQDEWICSDTMEILSTTIRSETLLKCFCWDLPLSGIVVAYQLLALAKRTETFDDPQAFRQTLATVIPRCYDLLNNHFITSSSEEKEKVLMILRDQAWIWVGDNFIRASQMAFEAPENGRPFLYSVTQELLCFESLLRLSGVRDRFSADDFVNLSLSLNNRLEGRPASSKQLDLAVFIAKYLSRLPQEELLSLNKENLFLPSKECTMHLAKTMTFDDAPWLSAIVSGKASQHRFVHEDVGNDTASILGAKSLRDVLSARQNGMVKIPCPKSDALAKMFSERKMCADEDCRVIFDLLEIAEMKGVKQVSIFMDRREHGSMSILHPCLTPTQKAALVVCFHDTVIEVDELVKLTSPSKYYTSTVAGSGGCGGPGFPRFGGGLCGTFLLSDCLQVLAGRSILFWDPNGEFFVEGTKNKPPASERDNKEKLISTNEDSSLVNGTEIFAQKDSKRRRKASGRNYGISPDFPGQFPDQFEPFFSLPLGIKESLCDCKDKQSGAYYRGTVFRIPLRTDDCPPSAISNRILDDGAIASFLNRLVDRIPRSFLFTYNLQSISINEWLPSEATYRSILRSRISSSPIARRNHLDEMRDNKAWVKEKGSKFTKLFKSSWVPKKSSYTLQCSNKHGEEESEVVDTFIIQAILAPPRLREMASTDALKPLNLIPAVTFAVHVHSSPGQKQAYKPPQGSIFVGLDTGIKTGLPFYLNAPLFQHETRRTLLLQKEDDEEFRRMIPGIRNITVQGKNGQEPRALALYVWNCQCITSAMKELIPSTFKDLRDPIQHVYSRDPRQLYKYWPYYSRMPKEFQQLMPKIVYEELSKPDVFIFLTGKDGFRGINEGYFASPDYTVTKVLVEFFRGMSLFTVPRMVVEDLSRFGIDMKQLTPSFARAYLKKQVGHVQWISNRPREALEMLDYCLADIASTENFETDSYARNCLQELRGICLMPLSDGTVGMIGRPMIIATAEQQEMLPRLKNKFVSSSATRHLKPFFDKPGFLGTIGLTKFSAKTLGNNIASVLPSSWMGKNFVPWYCEDSQTTKEGPTRLWIHQFWKEVSICDHDTIQLFRQWPLIPTVTGELASCGNARFVLSFYANSGNTELSEHLQAEYSSLQKSIEDEEKRREVLKAAEKRANRSFINDGSSITDDKEFWEMGAADDEMSLNGSEQDEPELLDEEKSHQSEKVVDDDMIYEENSSQDAGNEPGVPPSLATDGTSDGASIALPSTVSLDDSSGGQETIPPSSMTDDINSSTRQALHKILAKIRCPLIELSFFSSSDISRMMSPDRLSVSRSTMTTLNQCMNYWTTYSVGGEQRLDWSALCSDEKNQLLLLLTKNQGSRLSLMPSDLSMLRNIPVFETVSGERVSLTDRGDHFTLDNNVDTERLSLYLPGSQKSKFLVDRPEISDLLVDLNVQSLNEADLLKKFVLPEFLMMPLAQKEAVCETILAKWGDLKVSNDFISVMKETHFVKQATRDNGLVFVTASQLFDPRNEFLRSIFDEDQAVFPAEEFLRDEWLVILSEIGLKSNVDKDTFLQCAWRVEEQENTQKAMKLFEYYKEHFAEFFDTHDFSQKLADIQCVPAEFDGVLGLYKFREISVPKDRDLCFKVLPVIPDLASPPQVMFSSLQILSPPSIGTVLKQIRALTENGGNLDQWNYKYGSVEHVFTNLLSFLQENYDRLSPRVQEGLCERPLVPVGTTLVRASRLFFRLAKDLAPFFYEVPRAFGAYDLLLRKLGVCDSPKPEDYASSLIELKQEMGDVKLNANELNSTIEVINLVANEEKSSISHSSLDSSIFAPNSNGVLVSTDYLLQNDCPWLVRGGRLDLSLVHLAHPKLSKELCDQLHIRCMSECIMEVLEEGFQPKTALGPNEHIRHIQEMMHSDSFVTTMDQLRSSKSVINGTALKQFRLVPVELLRTQFLLSGNGQKWTNITNNPVGTYCLIDGSTIFVSKLPQGLTVELVVASALCDLCKVPKQNVPGLSAMLASNPSNIDLVMKTMGIKGSCETNDEIMRGEPGYPLVGTDLELIELKPLKVFTKGEIVAVHNQEGPSPSLDAPVLERGEITASGLVYGVVVENGGGKSLSRLRICVGKGKEVDLISSQVFTLQSGVNATKQADSVVDYVKPHALSDANGLLRPADNNENDFELTLTSNEDGTDSATSHSALRPVDRRDIVHAVEDLLKSANLSLDDDVKQVMESNLELRDQIAQKDLYMDSLKSEGQILAKNISKGMDVFLCPITRELMEDPVICSDGHTYERYAIEMWLRTNSRSPKTNQPLSSRRLIPNHAMRNTIEAMTENMDAVKKFSNAFD